MKQTSPFPLTRDNFSQCWQYIDHIRRKARLKSVVSKIGGFLTNLIFLFTLLFMVNGIIYQQSNGQYHEFLESLPLFAPAWERLTGFLLRPGDTRNAQIIRLLLITYGASILIFAVLTLLISLVYHPAARKCPEGTYQEKAALLAKAAQEARANSYMTHLSTSIVSMVLTIFAAFLLLFAYAVYIQDAAVISSLLSRFPTSDAATNCLLYVLAGYFVIHFFSSILLFCTRFLYRYEVPYDLVVQAEAGALYAAEDSEGLSSEALSAHWAEQAAKWRDEALALEKDSTYGKAKQLLRNAAICADVPAMEHYARHCLIGHMDDSARYWLQRCVDSGSASEEARIMLRRMKLHLRHNVEYLKPDAAPLSTGTKVWRSLLTVLSVIWRVLILGVFVCAVLLCVLMFKSGFDPAIFEDLPGAISHYFG